ncbi:hypothetical protein AB0A81_38810 [Streptomyces flaveolus]|uniref:Uncharacterized protein n=1 Tax=Streptomyces flaveolus TaxID=67297 RepID=A0ABV1VB75_9ACTN
MNVTPSGYVCTRPDILASLREEAARTPAHRQFTKTAITAFEEDGPDAEPLLNGCPETIARLIFDEVAEAYDPGAASAVPGRPFPHTAPATRSQSHPQHRPPCPRLEPAA